MTKVYISLGTNLGQRKDNLQQAIELISENIGKICSASKVYQSEPWGFSSENIFLNQVICVKTNLKANETLRKLLEIETTLGRLRIKKQTYKDRIIDLDILFFGSQIIQQESLIIPHPHLQNRNFVLHPIAEIAPNYVHPILKTTMQALVKQSPDKVKTWPYEQ